MTTPEANAILRDVRAALGEEPVDLLLENCRLVNVWSLEVHRADIAILGSRIVAIREGFRGEARERLDCSGRYALPGLVAAFFGTESAPDRAACAEFEREGVTSVVLPSGERKCEKEGNGMPRLYSGDAVAPIQPQTSVRTAEEARDAVRNGTAARIDASSDDPRAFLEKIRRWGLPLTHLWFQPMPGDGGRVAEFLARGQEVGWTLPECVRMATLNTARQFRLDQEVGSLAPGRRADVLLIDDPACFSPARVVFDGRLCGGKNEGRQP